MLLCYPTHTDVADNVDKLARHEGVFLATALWMAEALALIGRDADAKELFDRLIRAAQAISAAGTIPAVDGALVLVAAEG
ncbi:hypothetical protein [Kitasatospora sp. NPDC098663]|uniref:hypothetical protein n=1 Tax=Kitasatospora sp. NPDC098663 TaxID=3364096 RepID=UPI0038302A57